MRTLSLKIDVCTYEGLHAGVEPLLDLLARHDVRATFCLSFGPDNSGKALRHLFRPGFLKKMLRTRVAATYGLRTLVSGTLLPARPVASAAPELVRRIANAGHEIALHGWDHRRWQDELPGMTAAETRRELEQACASYAACLGRRADGTASPGWIATPTSLATQDSLGFRYASDLRGGPPCRLQSGSAEEPTLQIPTTGPCIEELLAAGVRGDDALSEALLAGVREAAAAVLAIHAEIEGRAFLALFDRLLPRLRADRDAVVPLRDLASDLCMGSVPLRRLVTTTLPGRAGTVATSAPLGTDGS